MAKFLSEKISLEECQKLIKEGIENREDNFLFSIENLIYKQKTSPYLKLLKLSNISFEDVKKMISREGIEGTLRILRDEGVYLTFKEFKGIKKVKRKGQTFRFEYNNFSNPFGRKLGEVYSGGSGGPTTVIHWGIGYLMQKLIHEALMFEMHDCFNVPFALWFPTFPSQFGLYPFRLIKLGIPLQVWFSQVKRNKPISFSSRILSFLNSKSKKHFVLKNTPIKHVSLRDAYIVAEWAAQKIKDNSICVIHTSVSAAVRICVAAEKRNLNIRNTKFIVGSEPLTKRKFKEIKELGCEAISTYYFSEGGFLGCSCNNLKRKVDEIHFFKDSFAIIQHSREIERNGDKVNAFLLTSLYPECPIVMLNLENGDYGVIEKKQCGCLFDKFSFNEHIYNIRSHEKITTEGMTFHISDIINIIEDVLPEEFGGRSIDYQLVEEECANGLTHLVIYVSHQIEHITEERMKQILFEKLCQYGKRDMRVKIWNQVEALKIRRQEPLTTSRGKTFPFYQNINK